MSALEGSAGAAQVSLSIDGKPVTVAAGSTLLEAAGAAGARIPTLCFDERLAPFGACRVCLVALAGSERLLPACTTICEPGMSVDTRDQRARALARTIVELVLSELPEAPPDGSELASVAAELGARRGRFSGAVRAVRHDENHPYLALRHELCISCGRCVRICDELQGSFALSATGRGFAAGVAAGIDAGFAASACVACGACAETCPTGAISERSPLEPASADRGRRHERSL